MQPVVVTITEEPLAVSIASDEPRFGPVELPMTPALQLAAEQAIAVARGLAGMPLAQS